MISWGPVFGDYAIMACSCAWLAFNTYDGVRRTWALVRWWWRRRKAPRLIRIGNPTYGKATARAVP